MVSTSPGFHLPVCFDVIILQGKKLLLNLVPALQTAPQPVGVYNMEVFAVLSLSYFFCAYYEVKQNSVPRHIHTTVLSTHWF